MFIATVLAGRGLGERHVSAAVDVLVAAGCDPGGARWLDEGSAFEVAFEGDAVRARSALRRWPSGADIVVQAEAERAKRLFVADMDSTMIAVECIDELADYGGLKAEVAAITERAMRGELPFAEALAARVALLKDLTLDQLEACRVERVRANPGARRLVRTLGAHGVRCLLVTGGFTAFAEPVAAELGFHAVWANLLEAEGGRLTGRVLGPIVDGDAKRAALIAAREEAGAGRHEVLAIGDGANDLSMVREAGLGVAYRAKPVLAEAADARLDHADLDALLHVVGIPRDRWVGD